MTQLYVTVDLYLGRLVCKIDSVMHLACVVNQASPNFVLRSICLLRVLHGACLTTARACDGLPGVNGDLIAIFVTQALPGSTTCSC